MGAGVSWHPRPCRPHSRRQRLPQCRARGRGRAPGSLPARAAARGAPDDLVPRPLPAAFLCCCPALPARIPRCLPPSSLSSGHASSTTSIRTSPSSRCAPTAPAMIPGCEGCACRNRAACTLLVAVIRLVVDGPLVPPACLRCWGYAVATRVLEILAVAQSATFPTLRSPLSAPPPRCAERSRTLAGQWRAAAWPCA
jgi:hypothetical protein